MADSSGELSHNKLMMLLGLLGIIWILCYNAELQLPARHIIDTYDRIYGRNINETSLQLAIDLAKNVPESNQKQKQRFSEQYNIKTFIQKPICVILSQTNPSKDATQTIKSIFQQEYTNYKVHYYTSQSSINPDLAKKYLTDNALNSQKLDLIKRNSQYPLFDHFLAGQQNCKDDDIVIFITDDDVVLGNYVFELVNTFFSKNQKLNILYSGSLVNDEAGGYRLGYSYPYPSDTIEYTDFRNFPFVMGGIRAFKNKIYSKVQRSNLLQQSTKQFYQNIKSIVFGVKLLELSQKQIQYVQEPMLLEENEQIYVTYNKSMKQEIKQLYSQKNVINL